ncbi:MAG: mandelate racemase/muconate lactonizing enzyme family protein [Acidobacteria bacterium]|nr:mandelate racemase/muconate lactonizing enzyme family protein [Acidobacteriota bacterium]
MFKDGLVSRRGFMAAGAALSVGAAHWEPRLAASAPRVRVTGFELVPIRASERTVWLIVRLHTNAGLTGLGEASDAFGYANTTKQDAARMEAELRGFFGLINGRSPLEINHYRARSAPLVAKGGLVSATACSAIEQALWDLAGKALDVPTYALFGGRVRDTLPVYANVNRATKSRKASGFAATAKAAVADGFRAVKAAPFDGFPPPGSPASSIEAAVENGIAAVAAMRDAIGVDVDLMVDCHSFFDVSLAIRVAARLEPYRLAWYEEPVAPERTEETREIRRRIQQPMAGGEILFGTRGFAPLCRNKTVDVIMPDVKHCGGLLELTRIAAVAEVEGVDVAPHNPSGPISTAASILLCAVLPNFRVLELQWGEVAWRGDILTPPERFVQGTIAVPDRPGFGVDLNEKTARAHTM